VKSSPLACSEVLSYRIDAHVHHDMEDY